MRAALEALARRPAAWAALLLAALALRLAVVATAPRALLWPDGRYFESIAHELATQGTYGNQTIYAPGYPTFIAGIYAFTGPDLMALRWAEAVLATATVALVGAFGARLFHPAAGLVAAALATFHPVMALLPVTQYSENLLLFLSALGLGAFGWALLRPSAARFAIAGLLFAALALTKPNQLTLLPGLALGAWWALGRAGAPRLRHALVFALALLAGLAPWVARNYRLHGRVIPITTGGGRQLWLGNNPAATGEPDWTPLPEPGMWRRIWASPRAADQEKVYAGEALRFMRQHPGRALQLYLVKMSRLWALYPRPATRTAYSRPWADAAQAACSVVIYAGALIGLFRLAPHGAAWLPLAVASFTVVNSVFLMVMRYRMSFEVALLWMAGLGWVSLLGARGPARAAGA